MLWEAETCSLHLPPYAVVQPDPPLGSGNAGRGHRADDKQFQARATLAALGLISNTFVSRSPNPDTLVNGGEQLNTWCIFLGFRSAAGLCSAGAWL